MRKNCKSNKDPIMIKPKILWKNQERFKVTRVSHVTSIELHRKAPKTKNEKSHPPIPQLNNFVLNCYNVFEFLQWKISYSLMS